ncbi:MAG: hypothetical protein NTY23_15655 [Chloroflexi bacterium]|nr:hypothetical protein [Chloroflexota bacterium]
MKKPTCRSTTRRSDTAPTPGDLWPDFQKTLAVMPTLPACVQRIVRAYAA